MDENYLKKLTGYALSRGILSDDDKIRLQCDLWTFLGQRASMYNCFDSSSFPVEAAQELLDSITYVIGLHLRNTGSADIALSKLMNTHISDLFYAGLEDIARLIDMGRELLNRLNQNPPEFKTRSYRDSLHEIHVFFKKYDYRYFAKKIPCMLDYQLCHPICGLYGIEFINEYMRRLIIENEFCSRFSGKSIEKLLKAYCPDPEEQLINVYEALAVNSLGLAMSGGDIHSLNISASDRSLLLDILKGAPEPKLSSILSSAADTTCKALSLNVDAEKDYLLNTAVSLQPRLMSGAQIGILDNIFISFE